MSETVPPVTPDERELWNQARAHYVELMTKRKHDQVFWHGKYMTVKHENNKLRGKVWRLQVAMDMFRKLLEDADTDVRIRELRERFEQWKKDHNVTAT